MNVHPTGGYPTYPLVDAIRQSPQIDFDAGYEAAWLKGKTALITGGASGFGAGFARKWAASGANVIIGDVNVDRGTSLAREISAETGNDNVHFLHCDVTDWQSQVAFFKEGIKLSPHGGLDIVVANAGIAYPTRFEAPTGLDAADPPKPDLKIIDVNLTGVLYTTHLALFFLPRNPSSQPSDATADPATRPRDRHLLLVGSMASLGPLPAQTLYCTAKHGVAGLFRTLRGTAWVQGVRTNLLCPFFIDTPILPARARAMMAGGGLGKPEDVVDAATRLAADSRIVGRSMAVGPRMLVEQDEKGEYQLALVRGKDARTKRERAVWEAYAHDYDDSEIFSRNLLRLINAFTRMRGWAGWFWDLLFAFRFGLRRATGKK